MNIVHWISRRRQSGAAAVELALLMPLLMVPVIYLAYIGTLLYHYTVVHKAAQDAARYMSSITVEEIRSQQFAPAAANIAKTIARTEVAELMQHEGAPTVEVFCGVPRECIGIRNGPLPDTVFVRVEVYLRDPFLGQIDTGIWGMLISASVEMPYVGYK